MTVTAATGRCGNAANDPLGDHPLRRAATCGKWLAVKWSREARPEHERGRADGPLRVVPRIDLDSDVSLGREERRAEAPLECLGQMRPRLRPLAAEQYELGPEHVGEIADRAAEDRSGPREDRPRSRVPGVGERAQLFDPLTCRQQGFALRLRDERRICDDRLEAAVLAAATDRPVLDGRCVAE